VLGLLPDWRGEVTVMGRDARRDRREIRRRAGFMPEADTYIPEMTAIRAVRYLARLAGLPAAESLRRAHEVLFHVGLGEAIYRDIREFSTGMRQRFKLAQAIVHDPDVIFLDEPLSGLDPEGRDEVLALIRDLAKHHRKHLVWSSHILPEVQKVADAVVVLHQGRFRGTFRLEDLHPDAGAFEVVLEGDPRPVTTALVAEGISMDAVLREGEAADGEPGPGGRTTWLARLPAGRTPAALFAAARRAGARVRRVVPRTESLEEVFVRLLSDGEGH
jgi:ABC-2 type transport system ATP-binding protein